MGGIAETCFTLTLSDSASTPFRYLRCQTAGTVVLNDLDGASITFVVTAGEYIWCAGLRVMSTGSTAGIVIQAFR